MKPEECDVNRDHFFIWQGAPEGCGGVVAGGYVDEQSRGATQQNGKMGSKHRKKVKLLRAYGGCLGVSRRRRTRQAAKSHDEPQAGNDSWISEWGNPAGVVLSPERERDLAN